MIFDSVKNACLYLGLNPRLDTALRFLADGKFAEQAAGRYVLQENDITCSRFTAETHPWEEGFFESHRKFFDIHVPLSSKELLLTAPIERLVPDGDFDEAKVSCAAGNCTGTDAGYVCGLLSRRWAHASRL